MTYYKYIFFLIINFSVCDAFEFSRFYSPVSYSSNGSIYGKLHFNNRYCLISAVSPVCKFVELHTHISDNGVKKMRRVEAVNLPSLTSVFFKTGGFHLMLMNLKFYINENDLIPLKLIFNIKENTFAFAVVKEKRFFFYDFNKLRTTSRD